MLDIIGTLYDIDNSDPDNPVSTALEGYHINSTRKIVGADAYIVSPSTPRRVFAGTTTYYYTFASEDEAKNVITYDSEEDHYTPTFEPKPLPVPKRVSQRQLRLVLAEQGFLSDVERAIENIPDEKQRQMAGIEWQFASEIKRNNPWITAMYDQLGISQEDVDAIFVQASQI